MARGARLNHVNLLDNNLGEVYLDGVNSEHPRDFWHKSMVIEYWAYQECRDAIKHEIHRLRQEKDSRN